MNQSFSNTRVYLQYYFISLVGVIFLSSEANGFYPDMPPPPPYALRTSLTDDSCICPFYYYPICATDGNSYANSCFLKCARRKNPGILGLCYGECPCCKPRYTENFEDFASDFIPSPYGSTLYTGTYDDYNQPSNSSEILEAVESKMKRNFPSAKSKLERRIPLESKLEKNSPPDSSDSDSEQDE